MKFSFFQFYPLLLGKIKMKFYTKNWYKDRGYQKLQNCNIFKIAKIFNNIFKISKFSKLQKNKFYGIHEFFVEESYS